MLYPHEVIEYIIGAFIIFAFLVFAVFWYRKKGKKIGFYISVFVLISTICFFIFRPIWIEHQITKKSIIIESYLQEKYPDADWTITAQNFREDKTVNPYYLLVDFVDDPNHTYFYFAYSDGKVKQMGSQSETGTLSSGKYDESD